MATNYLAKNKKGNKIVITGKPKYYNVIGTAIQFLPILTYVGLTYDLFTFRDEGLATTGWFVVVLVILAMAFRSKVRDKMHEYEEQFGYTWKRIKRATTYIIIGLVLLGVYLFTLKLFILFLIYGGSSLLALIFYVPYDKIIVKKKLFQKKLDEEISKAEFESIQNGFENL